MGRIKHNAITDVSIHVPREGDDEMLDTIWEADFEVSIHVPREGDDRGRRQCVGRIGGFNPRPP